MAKPTTTIRWNSLIAFGVGILLEVFLLNFLHTRVAIPPFRMVAAAELNAQAEQMKVYVEDLAVVIGGKASIVAESQPLPRHW